VKHKAMQRTHGCAGKFTPNEEIEMSKTALPIPPANRSNKAGENKTGAPSEAVTNQDKPNPVQKGQQANTKQNTYHQGYQQDR
jgi:hypothetical protein